MTSEFDRAADAAEAFALSRDDDDYPEGLADLPDPPATLFVRGRLARGRTAVAIVGARAASPYGLARARALASDLAALGLPVVSGLARGVDAAAHRGALEASGSTVAVLPAGLDAITPPEHRRLADAIAAGGALVAECAAGTPVTPWRFVRRNRLIAALAAATVVVEAAERSGALVTAAIAIQLGRPVLAVPGDVDRPTSRGCHALIRRGARLCEGAGDVLAAIGAGSTGRATKVPRPSRATGAGAPPGARAGEPVGAPVAAAPAAALLGVLAGEPQRFETIVGRAGLEPGIALAELLRLEWAGLAVAFPGQRWARGSRA